VCLPKTARESRRLRRGESHRVLFDQNALSTDSRRSRSGWVWL